METQHSSDESDDAEVEIVESVQGNDSREVKESVEEKQSEEGSEGCSSGESGDESDAEKDKHKRDKASKFVFILKIRWFCETQQKCMKSCNSLKFSTIKATFERRYFPKKKLNFKNFSKKPP